MLFSRAKKVFSGLVLQLAVPADQIGAGCLRPQQVFHLQESIHFARSSSSEHITSVCLISLISVFCLPSGFLAGSTSQRRPHGFPHAANMNSAHLYNYFRLRSVPSLFLALHFLSKCL